LAFSSSGENSEFSETRQEISLKITVGQRAGDRGAAVLVGFDEAGRSG
jgi:hypothetical protein